jgi:hypothetical protein
MKLLRPWVVFIAGYFVYALPCSASFVDGFEGSTHFAGWVIEKTGAKIDISAEFSHGGGKAVKFTALPGREPSCTLEKSFDTRDLGTVSVWFYDTMAGNSAAAYLYLAHDDNTPLYVGIEDNDPTYYHAGRDSGGKANGRTKLKRSKGWHHFEIEVSKRGVICLVDSKIAYASWLAFNFNAAGLEMVGAGLKKPVSYYFDDFEILGPASVSQKDARLVSDVPAQVAAKPLLPAIPVEKVVPAQAPVVASAVVPAVLSVSSETINLAEPAAAPLKVPARKPAYSSKISASIFVTVILSVLAAALLYVLAALVWSRKLLVGTFGVIKRKRGENPCYGVSEDEHIEKLARLLKARSSWEISENFIHGSTVILSVNTRVLVVKKQGNMRDVRILKGKREGQAFWIHKSYIKPVK